MFTGHQSYFLADEAGKGRVLKRDFGACIDNRMLTPVLP